MSAEQQQQPTTDSDGSWTWVDDEDDTIRRRAAVRRASAHNVTRPEIEELATDSDVSILTDPEEHAHQEGEAPTEAQTELEKAKAAFKEMAAEVNAAVANQDTMARRPGESELAVVERRARAYFKSTLTSTFIMIGSLIIAMYCQWGCDSNFTSPVQEYYDDGGHGAKVGRDIEYIPRDYKHKFEDKHHAYDKYQDHKNAKYDKHEKQHDGGKKHEEKQKKGDYKHKKDYDDKKHDKRNEIKKGEKHKDVDEHKDYLYKKEAYLKQKEGKLKQKEFKLYAKDASGEKHAKKEKEKKKGKNDASGEWYDKMHKGRKEKRSTGEKAEWTFERAQGRDKKRDKAHWYFDMMDERETNRHKQRT